MMPSPYSIIWGSQARIFVVPSGGMIVQCMAFTATDRVATMTSIMSTTGDRVCPRQRQRQWPP